MFSFLTTNKYITQEHIKYYLILISLLSLYVFYYRYMKLYQNDPRYVEGFNNNQNRNRNGNRNGNRKKICVRCI